MEHNTLEIHNLNKYYGKFHALSNINLSIEAGSIYGLIGENGAGKTTLLKIITGLSPSYEGSLTLFNSISKNSLQENRKKIGCTIEAPALYSNLSVEDNLKLQQIQKNGNINITEILHILEIINLSDCKTKKCWKLSYGMKQRLAIGIALLNNPSFLILDEPINGLDPLGIKEIRLLLKKINEKYNTTILVSSHILSELENIITHYAILHEGEIIEQDTVTNLKKKEKKYIKVVTSDIQKAKKILDEYSIGKYSVENNEFIISESNIKVNELCKLLVQNDIQINEIRPIFEGLESYYLRLVRRM